MAPIGNPKAEVGVVQRPKGIGRAARDIRTLGKELLNFERANMGTLPGEVVEHVPVGFKVRRRPQGVEDLDIQRHHFRLEERQCLSAFRYGRNRAVLHRDAKLMPRRRRLWSSWNYMAERGAQGRSSSITYWMNALQPLATSMDIFVSLNPQREPEAALVEREFAYEHPIFTAEAGLMQKRLWSLQR